MKPSKSPYTRLVKLMVSGAEVAGCYAAVKLGAAGWFDAGFFLACMVMLFSYIEGHFWSFYEREASSEKALG